MQLECRHDLMSCLNVTRQSLKFFSNVLLAKERNNNSLQPSIHPLSRLNVVVVFVAQWVDGLRNFILLLA